MRKLLYVLFALILVTPFAETANAQVVVAIGHHHHHHRHYYWRHHHRYYR